MTDFIIYADEDWPQPFVYKDGTGNGIDLSNADILFVAKFGSTIIKKSTTEASITIADQNTTPGEFTVLLAGADTTAQGGTTFEYEIKVTLDTIARVIYPAPGSTATFEVLTSLTDGVTDELMSVDVEPPKVAIPEKPPKHTLRRVPKLPRDG